VSYDGCTDDSRLLLLLLLQPLASPATAHLGTCPPPVDYQQFFSTSLCEAYHLLPHLNPDWFNHSGKTGVVAVAVVLPFGWSYTKWLGSRVVSVLDSGAEGPGFKSQSRRCRVTVLSKLFTPVVPLFTKQQNW